MTTDREGLVQDIDTITRMVQDAIIEEVERNSENIGVFVTDALYESTKTISPDEPVTEEMFHKFANDAFFKAIFDTLDLMKASSF